MMLLQKQLIRLVLVSRVKVTSRSRSQSVIVTIQKSVQNTSDVFWVNLLISLCVTKTVKKREPQRPQQYDTYHTLIPVKVQKYNLPNAAEERH